MPILVIDTETTGWGKQDRVIELGAVALTPGGVEIGHFGSLVRPAFKITEAHQRALQVSGIREEELERAPEAGRVWETFLQWAGLHAPAVEVLAFNVVFDQRMMEQTFPGSVHLPWGDCIMRSASEKINGTRKSIKLATAAVELGVDLPNGPNHRAVYDATLAARVWAAL